MKSQRSKWPAVPVIMHLLALCWLILAGPAAAQITAPEGQTNITAQLVMPGPFSAGETREVALAFDPAPGWHGYWENPGDAGFGMTLDWQLPEGWSAGEPRYPVPEALIIGGLMNHVYNGPYAVLVPITAGANASAINPAPISVAADWLACTDRICVPEKATLTATISSVSDPAVTRQFTDWQMAIPPMIDSEAAFEIAGGKVRIGIPLPAGLGLVSPHLYIAREGQVDYAAPQVFRRSGDMLVAELIANDRASNEPLEGILAFGDGEGVRIIAKRGDVASGGTLLSAATPALWILILGALAGGLLLNIMPCVFPILSLKALSLARAGTSESVARREGIAYTAGVVLACLALGGLLLALRAAGEQIGWAFQLQEPGVVLALLVLAAAITANFAGLFELPSLPITRSGKPAGAFATGVLAAFVATPCTGPFMAAALGAALLLPTEQAMLLVGLLGLGLALPFLLLGFVPALRNMLPKPGPWMETFRRIMAVPMGLTALALVWLVWRLGGWAFALVAVLFAITVIIAFTLANKAERDGRASGLALAGRLAIIAILAVIVVPRVSSGERVEAEAGILNAQPFSAVALAEAQANGEPTFVWMTADWCVTCKINESVAIERENVRDAFARRGVTVLRGDWTRRDPEITRYLESKGAAGVPLYVWISEDGTEEVLPQILAPGSLVNLAKRPQETPRPRQSDPLPPQTR
ncbi:protein-disulfide reductase DsbD domain-containing protein [Altererythrobacter sp. ZODW24]|uniref:protein-disulfide reductase DsbD family protein n=1 Tax=Altererythrobacter sp. ZODW24 TaxID=2185142 RepID=UPI000DF74005|nr:protein-disulfide reductase DsbD domain-containing protein [Altererythrobacter sp. ZODW24]